MMNEKIRSHVTLLASLTLGLVLGGGVMFGAVNGYFPFQANNNGTNSTTTTNITTSTVDTTGSTSSFTTASATTVPDSTGSTFLVTTGSASAPATTGSAPPVSTFAATGVTGPGIISASTTGTGNVPGDYVSLPYCVKAWKPYCWVSVSSYVTCDYFDGNYIEGGQNRLLTCNISSNYSTVPYMTIVPDVGLEPQPVYCRVDPVTKTVCFSGGPTSTAEQCVRPKELVIQSYFKAPGQEYYLALAPGTCDNQLQLSETPEDKAPYYPLCNKEGIKEPVANTGTPYFTIFRSSNISHTLPLGVTTHITMSGDYAVGALFTGNSVCFQWRQYVSSYFDGYSPSYSSSCETDCVSLTEFPYELIREIQNYYTYPSFTNYDKVIYYANIENDNATSAAPHAVSAPVSSLASVIVAVGLIGSVFVASMFTY